MGQAPAADEFAAVCQSKGWPGRAFGAPSDAIRVQAQRPIESAAERKGASVGPEGPTERSN